VIFLDANIFIRFLVAPLTPQDARMAAASSLLFSQIEQGTIEAFASEATLAEVAFILTDRRHYAGPRSAAVSGIRPLLQPRTFRLHAKDVVLRALELWETNPKISFPDGLAAAYSEIRGIDVATYDSRLRAVPTATLHQF
jgi:predicted nucleic acid-binding protein